MYVPIITVYITLDLGWGETKCLRIDTKTNEMADAVELTAVKIAETLDIKLLNVHKVLSYFPRNEVES